MKRMDFFLFFLILALVFFGLLMIYDASSFIAFRDFSDKYHYIRDQFTWVILGIVGMITCSFFDYRRLQILAVPVMTAAIMLLILVFIPGIGVYALGANRWINAHFFILQPAEYVKLALAIYLAAWFSSKEKKKVLPFVLLVGFVVLLVMLEPDMGTTVIIFSEAMVIYFLAGGSISHFFYGFPVVALLAGFMVFFEPYRLQRLTSFFNIDDSLSQTSYHVKQILIALGMGGVTGVGLGNSLQKYAYLPENATDSIFAIIAEELGFVGSAVLIGVFLLIIWRGFLISQLAPDKFGKLLAGGIISFIAVQTLINIGAQTALFPLTGIPLPFVSYGGSSLVINMCAIGILLNISRRAKT